MLVKYDLHSYENIAVTNRLTNLIGILWVAGSLLALLPVNHVASAQEQEIGISKIADLMATPNAQLEQRKRIRVRGTVSLVGDGITTYERKHNATQSFCIEGPTASIWVRTGHAIREGLMQESESVFAQLDYGVEVELQGYLDQGAFAPVIMPTLITILGKSELPKAERAIASSFFNFAEELRRVTVNGVVQSVSTESSRWWSLRVETGVGYFVTRIPKEQQFSPERMLDAEVDLTGVAAVCWNWRSEFVCPRLIIAHRDDIRIIKPASDPFTAKLVSIENLDSYTPQGRPRHRRRIEGTVTYYDKDLLLYVQDKGIGVQVRLNEPVAVDVGDRVELSGFIDTSRYLSGLRGALLRPVGTSEDLTALPITITDIFDQHRSFRNGQASPTTSCDGQLIQLTGRLLNFQVRPDPKTHHLEIDCGDFVTTAVLAGGAREMSPGTELQVTGIAKLVFSEPDATASLAKPERVDLLLRDANDIVILSRPSWWTPMRTFNALVVVAGFALFAFLWAFTMRRTLTHRTDQLAHEMRGRRDAALEFQGAIRERTRLAANLHDTLLQTLAGIAYQIEACVQPEPSQQETLRSHLETASRMVQHGQDDLRATVWALHCLPLAKGTFADSVQQVTKKIGLGRDTAISVTSIDDFPVLADFIAGNLLLVIQESVHNAIKHANASKIDIELTASSDADRVSITVNDNGSGFNVKSRPSSSDGHFGIEGMEQRIERLGGTLVIESQIGVGTSVLVNVPLREYDPKIA